MLNDELNDMKLKDKKMKRRMKMHKVITKTVVGAAVLMTMTSHAWCKAGLATRFGDVFVENLDIGQSYNTRELASLPLKVTNTGDDTIDLIIDVQKPEPKYIKEDLIKQGYEPIPDPSWVKLSKDKFLLPAGESAFADVILTIPNDPALYGKKFQVDLWSHGAPKTFINLGINSHLMFTILPTPKVRAETEELTKKGLAANLNFDLVPDKVYVESCELGKTVSLKKIGKTIKIANSNDFPLSFTLTQVPIADTPLTLQQGFMEPKDLKWMTIKKQKIKIGSNSIKDIDLEINIPNDEAYRNKNYMFVFKVEPDTDKVVLVSFYGKVYVTTK
jgi:hypothetical protein